MEQTSSGCFIYFAVVCCSLQMCPPQCVTQSILVFVLFSLSKQQKITSRLYAHENIPFFLRLHHIFQCLSEFFYLKCFCITGIFVRVLFMRSFERCKYLLYANIQKTLKHKKPHPRMKLLLQRISAFPPFAYYFCFFFAY